MVNGYLIFLQEIFRFVAPVSVRSSTARQHIEHNDHHVPVKADPRGRRPVGVQLYMVGIYVSVTGLPEQRHAGVSCMAVQISAARRHTGRVCVHHRDQPPDTAGLHDHAADGHARHRGACGEVSRASGDQPNGRPRPC